jgi:thioredoxin reductase (NADPH)
MDSDFDLIVIGGGAAGLAAAQYGARANLKTLLAEELAAGGQALLIDSLENYPGVMGPVSGYDLSEAMRAQAEAFGTSFLTASVSALRKEGGLFSVETSEGNLRAKAVILATGAKHRQAGVPGEEEFAGRGVSYCATCDGPFFKGKRMLVVGGGDAACDEASYLAKLSDKIVLVHRKDRFRAQASLAARVLANPNIEVRFGTRIKEIKGSKKVESVVLEKAARTDSEENGPYEEPFDAVFVFVGSIPHSSLAVGVVKDEAGYIQTDDRMATSLPGLFAAGDVRASSFRQLITAASDGAIAAHSASQYIDEMKGEAYA